LVCGTTRGSTARCLTPREGNRHAVHVGGIGGRVWLLLGDRVCARRSNGRATLVSTSALTLRLSGRAVSRRSHAKD
jgi:hypothetical protein